MAMEEKNILFLNKKLKKRKILNYINKHDQVMVQKFLPKIKEGDKRVFVIGGVIKGAIRRVPKRGSIISNIGQGGIPTNYFNKTRDKNCKNCSQKS